jgi:hypothetical protein
MTTTAVRTTENGKSIITITRGDTVIVRKGKAEVRKAYASTGVAIDTGKVYGFLSVNPGGGGSWATDWEWVAVTGDPPV